MDKEEKGKEKGLEGTGLNLPSNRHGNLISASSDDNLKDIFHQIRTSKTPAVVNYGASWVCVLFDGVFSLSLFVMSKGILSALV